MFTFLSLYCVCVNCMFIMQGNGHERDFIDTEWVHTLDLYNHRIYPFDGVAMRMYYVTDSLGLVFILTVMSVVKVVLWVLAVCVSFGD